MAPRNMLDRLRETGGCCIYCGHQINAETATIDHIIPQSKGGPNEDFNKVASCKDCNQKKGNLMPSEFLAQMPVRKRKGYENRIKSLYMHGLLAQDKMELLLTLSRQPIKAFSFQLRLFKYYIKTAILVRKKTD